MGVCNALDIILAVVPPHTIFLPVAFFTRSMRISSSSLFLGGPVKREMFCSFLILIVTTVVSSPGLLSYKSLQTSNSCLHMF